jgi:predicted permease
MINDIRYALRSLRKHPGFSTVAIVTLALGIGANTAIFSVVHGILLRPLPYPDADRVFTIWEDQSRRDGPAREWTSRSVFRMWREHNRSFAQMAAISDFAPNLTGVDEPLGLVGELVTPGYFAALGVPPALGRAFLPEEETPGRGRAVVLSHELWQRRFGGDPGILDRVVTLNGEGYSVVGVMPAGFRAPITPTAEIWAPLDIDPARTDWANAYLRVVARLGPDMSADAARADLERVAGLVAAEQPTYYRGVGAVAVPIHQTVVGTASTPLLVLLGAVGLVLAIACANVANLLIARMTGRARELAIRAGLGAGAGRLARQLLTESVTLALIGGAIGVALGVWGTELLKHLAPPGTPRLADVRVDLAVLGFALGIALLTGLAFGVLPALAASRPALLSSLREGARGTETAGAGRVRRGLVAVELALGLTLLAGAGLLVRSLLALNAVDPGFTADRILTARVLAPASRYPERHHIAAFWRDVETRLAGRPEVRSAGLVLIPPFGGDEIDLSFLVEGVFVPDGDEPGARYRIATPGFFETLELRVRQGRAFDAGDGADAQVVVINRTMAERHFPDGDAVGRRIRIGNVRSEESPWWTVVGVIDDVRHTALDERSREEMYVPAAVRPARVMFVTLAGHGAPLDLVPVLREVVRSIDPDLPITQVAALDALIGTSLATRRFVAYLLAGFAGVALVLAAVGVYGVVSYAVGRRTREIGIRMALGAGRGDVLRNVMGQGLVMTGVGIGIGLIAAVLVTRALTSLLFGVAPTDPFTFAVVALILTGAALAACYVPARRATRVDPMEALRSE